VSSVFSVVSAVGNRKHWSVTFLCRVYHLKCNTVYNRMWRLTRNISIGFFGTPLPGYVHC
jgi:hypothetical protein